MSRLVKDFFAAMGSDNEHDLLALAAEDIEWIIPGEGWPLAGTHRGHAGLAAVLKKASEAIEMTYPKPLEFVAQEDRVLVVGVATGKIIATHKTFEGRLGLRHYRSRRQSGAHPGVYRHAGTGAGFGNGRVRAGVALAIGSRRSTPNGITSHPACPWYCAVDCRAA